MNTGPLVSIVLASYNGEEYIAEQIDSILAQTHQNFELIVSDNASKDRTPEIVRSYLARDSRVSLVNCSIPGLVANFSHGLTFARGEYICFADQDDYWLPNKLSLMLGGIGEAWLLHTDAKLADENLSVFAESYMGTAKSRVRTMSTARDYLFTNNATGCTMMIRRELAQRAFPVPDGIEVIHDWWCALYAAALGKLAYLDAPTILYRQHANNAVGAIGHRKGIGEKLSSMFDLRTYLYSLKGRALLFARHFDTLSRMEFIDGADRQVARDLSAMYRQAATRRYNFRALITLFKYAKYFRMRPVDFLGLIVIIFMGMN